MADDDADRVACRTTEESAKSTQIHFVRSYQRRIFVLRDIWREGRSAYSSA